MSNIIVFLAVSFVVSLIGFTSVQFLVNQHKAVKEGRAVTNPQTPFIVIGCSRPISLRRCIRHNQRKHHN